MIQSAIADPKKASEIHRKYKFEQACKKQLRELINDQNLSCNYINVSNKLLVDMYVQVNAVHNTPL